MEGQDTTRWKYFFDTLRIAETPATLTLEAVRTGIGWERKEKSWGVIFLTSRSEMFCTHPYRRSK